jgi:hypothetical protein
MAGPPARNPFSFGGLAVGESFADREDEVRELTADIRNGQDVVVFAPRRYGKSSLIRRVVDDLSTGGVLIAQVDLMRTPTRERLAGKLAKAIHEEIATPILRGRERLRVFANLRIKPKIVVDPSTGAVSFGFDARGADGDIDATLEELLGLPGRLAATRKRRVAVVLDEFQEVVELGPGLLALMRSVFQEQPEVAHVYLGSRRHMMERIFNDEHEPFWRSAKRSELGVIAPPLFARHAVARFTSTGRTLGSDACQAVLAATGGHPNATQELLYFVWEATPPGAVAGAGEFARALESVLRSEQAHFSLIWERAAAAQRLVLAALAAEQPGHPLSEDYQARHGLPRTPTVQAALGALVRGELVSRSGRGRYAIAEPFLAEWISRGEA